MLEILRGFQGVGAAASIPASVSTPLLRDYDHIDLRT